MNHLNDEEIKHFHKHNQVLFSTPNYTQKKSALITKVFTAHDSVNKDPGFKSWYKSIALAERHSNRVK